MKTASILMSLVILILPLTLLGADNVSSGTGDGIGPKLALKEKKRLVAHYSYVVEQYRERSEEAMVALLDQKILGLQHEIAQDEKAVNSKGPALSAPTKATPVKPEAHTYAKSSCEELKALLVQVLRKRSPLVRRTKSTFSALSQAEKDSLAEVENERQVVLGLIKSKCPPSSSAMRRSASRP